MTSPLGFTDAAKRISDACQQAIADGHGNQWLAFALDDGTTDGTYYQQKRDAVRHHGNRARLYLYLKVPLDMVTVRAAEVYLLANRQMAALGQHMADDEMPDTEWRFDNRREAAAPTVDARRLLTPDELATRQRRFHRRTRTGLHLPRGHT